MTAAQDAQVSADNFPPGSWVRGQSMRWTPRLLEDELPPWSWLCAPLSDEDRRWIAEDTRFERATEAAEGEPRD